MATKNIKLDEATAKKLYKTASPELRVILEENFEKIKLSSNPRDLIQTIDDAFEITGSLTGDIPYFGKIKKSLTKKAISLRAFATLQVIIEAYNTLDEKPELDWKNTNQPKYYLWFEKKLGGWVLDRVGDRSWTADLSAGFYFKSAENARDCYEKFKDLWEEYLPE